MPDFVVEIFNGIMILVGCCIAGGAIYSGLEKIAKVLKEKQ